jgi:hypothetical protein
MTEGKSGDSRRHGRKKAPSSPETENKDPATPGSAHPGDWTGNAPGSAEGQASEPPPRISPEEFLAAQKEPGSAPSGGWSRDWSGGGEKAPPHADRIPRTRFGPQSDIIDPEFLDKMFAGLRFPASLESVICHLVGQADARGGRNRVAELHDLIVQLDLGRFRGLDDLKRAVRGRFAWERSHPAWR